MSNLINKTENNLSLRKANRFQEIMAFILNHIESEEDLGYVQLSDYKKGVECFENELVDYSHDEDSIWDKMFKQAGVKNYEEMELEFLNSRFCNWENLLLVEMTNGSKFCILRC